MKKPLIVALGMLAALSFACSPGQQGNSALPSSEPEFEMTAEVHAAAEARVKALESGDVEAYLSVYADDAVWMPPDSAIEIVGKEAARLRMSQTFEAATLEPMIQSQEQTVMSPEWIADRGQYSIMVTPKEGGESSQEVGSYLTLWHRNSDGEWEIHFDIWNTNSPIVSPGQAK